MSDSLRTKTRIDHSHINFHHEFKLSISSDPKKEKYIENKRYLAESLSAMTSKGYLFFMVHEGEKSYCMIKQSFDQRSLVFPDQQKLDLQSKKLSFVGDTVLI